MQLEINVPLQGGAVFRAICNSFGELDSVRDYMSAQGLLAGDGAPVVPAAGTDAQPDKEPTKRTRKGADKPADATPNTPAPAADATSKAASLDDVTNAVKAYADKFGVPEVLKINQHFGVKRAGELKDDQYAEYISLVGLALQVGMPFVPPAAASAEPSVADLV